MACGCVTNTVPNQNDPPAYFLSFYISPCQRSFPLDLWDLTHSLRLLSPFGKGYVTFSLTFTCFHAHNEISLTIIREKKSEHLIFREAMGWNEEQDTRKFKLFRVSSCSFLKVRPGAMKHALNNLGVLTFPDEEISFL